MKITIENLGLIPKRGFFHPPAKITVDGEKYLVHDTREYCYLGSYLATWGEEQA